MPTSNLGEVEEGRKASMEEMVGDGDEVFFGMPDFFGNLFTPISIDPCIQT